ncbi:TolC family protein [Arcobacter sp. YIC-310]|uniref:TolC family protein n=1 Tax=Arcobacter sp. YIC-310 TaxID=3376632 RepID=UPI003C28B6FD
MKKIVLTTALTAILLNAQNIKENKALELENQKDKQTLESELTKNSWINSLSITTDSTKSKSGDSKSTSNKVYLDFNQDIFRSGGILYTIHKGKLQKDLAFKTYDKNLNALNIDIFKTVLELNKIDLQIKKQNYLIKNKTLEIEKKEEQYLNSLIDIEELDSAIIEKNDLLNQIEDLKTSKDDFLKQLKTLSSTTYQNIKVQRLHVVELEKYLDSNKELIIKDLNIKILKKDIDITNTNYLPKISLFSQLGYEDNNQSNINDDYYNYGVRVSIPLDYNMNKQKQLSRINYNLSKIEKNIKKDEEINKYKNSISTLKRIDNKIKNTKKSIESYKRIYKLTKNLVEGFLKTKQELKTIKNRLESSKIDIDILNIDKQLIIYDLYKNI